MPTNCACLLLSGLVLLIPNLASDKQNQQRNWHYSDVSAEQPGNSASLTKPFAPLLCLPLEVLTCSVPGHGRVSLHSGRHN